MGATVFPGELDMLTGPPGGTKSMPDEIMLIEKAKDLDSDAWAEIYNLYYHRIYVYLYHSLGNADLAEDMVSSVFVGALERIGTFTYRGISLSAWLYRIAHNMVVDHFRKSKITKMPLREESAVTTDSMEDAAERILTGKRLSVAMQSLTEEQQQVIMLKFVDGLSNAEVAQALNKPESAVKSLQHRALGSMRRLLWRKIL